jgi:membrane protease YdiL (CAAX protease family)
VKFFALTYAVTWACWLAAATVSGNGESGSPMLAALRMPLFYLGTFAPSLVALGLTARADGRAGARALLDRILQGPVRARWFVFAAGYMAAIKLTVALVHRVGTGAWPRFGDEAWYIMVVATIFSTPVQAGEEIGWRGYALPRLAARFGLGRASALLGVIWACWHLPLFFIAGTDTTGQSFPLYLLQVTALSVAMGWLFGHTHGSLLLVMLLHSAVNNTKDIVPSAVPGAGDPFALSTSLVAWITVALLWICAGYFLVRMPRWDAARSGATSPAELGPQQR